MAFSKEILICQWTSPFDALRSEKPETFESLASQVEEDPSFIQTLWATLPSMSPAEIFKKESIFPLVLKEAFERLLCSKPEKLDLPGVMESMKRGQVFFWQTLSIDVYGQICPDLCALNTQVPIIM